MDKVIYKGKIRDGKPGEFSAKDYEVLYNEEKKYAYLSEFPEIDYVGDTYRKLVNDSEMVEDYFKAHDSQQPGYYKFIQPHYKRGMIVADCGCGGGAMLDLLKGFAKQTLAIEPFLGYHPSLQERGHITFPSVEGALEDGWKGKVNLALSIHVIEHTPDVMAYLKSIYDLLDEGGTAIIFTPNLNDLLMELRPDVYEPFFYKTVHNYYFSGESLEILGKDAGFKEGNAFYYQEFGLSNTFFWLKDGVARSQARFGCVNDKIDAAWITHIEETGRAYNVGVVLKK